MAGLNSNTKLLLHCNGVDESTLFPDASDSKDRWVTSNPFRVFPKNTSLSSSGSGMESVSSMVDSVGTLAKAPLG